MNADAFRHLYGYHFAQNRELWDKCIVPLSHAQFVEDMGYSYGTVRDQIVHLIGADELWFCELQNIDPSKPFPAEEVDDRKEIRARWDEVEQMMRGYLAKLHDDMLFEKPIQEPEDDKDLITWQVLLHVVNHGTDHRAQVLRFLTDLGVKTESQDYIFYVYGHPV